VIEFKKGQSTMASFRIFFLFLCQFAYADQIPIETDRGYREPAIEATAILDEEMPPNEYNNFNSYDLSQNVDSLVITAEPVQTPETVTDKIE
jgi:hypothetical protein